MFTSVTETGQVRSTISSVQNKTYLSALGWLAFGIPALHHSLRRILDIDCDQPARQGLSHRGSRKRFGDDCVTATIKPTVGVAHPSAFSRILDMATPRRSAPQHCQGGTATTLMFNVVSSHPLSSPIQDFRPLESLGVRIDVQRKF